MLCFDVCVLSLWFWDFVSSIFSAHVHFAFLTERTLKMRYIPCFCKQTGRMSKFHYGTWHEAPLWRFLYCEGNFFTDPLMRQLDPSNLAMSWIGTKGTHHEKLQNAETYLTSLRQEGSRVARGWVWFPCGCALCATLCDNIGMSGANGALACHRNCVRGILEFLQLRDSCRAELFEMRTRMAGEVASSGALWQQYCTCVWLEKHDIQQRLRVRR